MRKFYEMITRHPKRIIFLFLLAAILAAVAQPFVSVNYDMNDYLPEDSKSTVSIDVMNEEFEGGIPNCRVMVSDVTIPGALKVKEKLEAVEGVSEVMWLDDNIDIKMPLSMQDKEVIETYYRDRVALFSITIDEEHILSAVPEIRKMIGEENAMSGSAVSTEVATFSTVSEIRRIAIFAVLFVIFVLIITTTSYAEPFVILVGLGIAILINAGTNLIFGEISFVSNAAGSILQLAVSLDYSVFLLHRFEEYRKECATPREAMVEALCKSTSSILSSGVTTVIGFVALCLMRFRIGPDLGLVLAKGVAISLISVFIFMPSFLLLTYRWIDKLRHKKFLPSFDKLGRLVAKVMIPLSILFVFLIVPSFLASNSNDFYYGSANIFGKETKLGSDTAKIEDTFGKSDTYVLLVPKGDNSTERALSDKIHKIPEVTGIVSYVDTVGEVIPSEYLPEETYHKLVSDKYSRFVISLDTESEGADTFALVEKIRQTADEFYKGKSYLAGNGVSTYDLMDTVTSDMLKVNLIAIAAVFLVLVLTLKSVILPVILVLSIETAIWINLSFPYYFDSPIFYIAYLIISSIQLGSTVDYAILMTDRYREFAARIPGKKAVAETISTVAVSIMTSASVLTVVGFLLGMLSTHGLLAQLGIFIGRGTVCSFLIVFFVLPGLLYVSDLLFYRRK